MENVESRDSNHVYLLDIAIIHRMLNMPTFEDKSCMERVRGKFPALYSREREKRFWTAQHIELAAAKIFVSTYPLQIYTVHSHTNTKLNDVELSVECRLCVLWKKEESRGWEFGLC